MEQGEDSRDGPSERAASIPLLINKIFGKWDVLAESKPTHGQLICGVYALRARQCFCRIRKFPEREEELKALRTGVAAEGTENYAASAISSSTTGAGSSFAGAFTDEDAINGRSNRRKNTYANVTDNGVVISNEIVRMCSFVKPNQYQCIRTRE